MYAKGTGLHPSRIPFFRRDTIHPKVLHDPYPVPLKCGCPCGTVGGRNAPIHHSDSPAERLARHQMSGFTRVSSADCFTCDIHSTRKVNTFGFLSLQNPCYFELPSFGRFFPDEARAIQHVTICVPFAFVAIASATWVVYECGRSGSSSAWQQVKDLSSGCVDKD